MKFGHLVKYNGQYYPAGADVPVGDNSVKEVVEKDVKPIVEKQPQYTKTEINRLSTAELKSLALKQGIDNAEEMTGADLKKVLIEKFGL